MGEVGQFVALRLSLLHMQPLAFALHFAQIKIHKRNLPVGIYMYEVKREEKALAKYFLSPSTQLAKYTAELGPKTIPVCENSAANWMKSGRENSRLRSVCANSRSQNHHLLKTETYQRHARRDASNSMVLGNTQIRDTSECSDIGGTQKRDSKTDVVNFNFGVLYLAALCIFWELLNLLPRPLPRGLGDYPGDPLSR